ncbi:RNA polymerase sigma factor SigJ [Streptomyces sp. SID3212]|uniref:RNA polymerase sigma factor SigJ n=1 Tax=Streptomyces sp. SID3212 TaxID=2690259 RepID=UPI0013693D5C|nr:RNA polymerase sigma factor SigJ [Streptomyces sp. SID3212]MYV53076.1 sigma-70 family RNA polymerase sigma factor [Streptomyces sp. SID3212]
MPDTTSKEPAKNPTPTTTPITPSTPPAPPTPTQVFTDHRELLFSLVYNMLGSVADTEDVLQETWLAWAARNAAPGAAPVNHPRAYLVRIAVNGAVARRAAITRRRETYVGSWLPEPLVATPATDTGDAAEAVERAESVSLAMMVVLETLTPLERAVFVLHEVFGYAHTETADILGRTPAAVRQLAHRAREHVHARRPRYRADPKLRQQVTERFVAAAFGGDLEALLRLLAPDVTLWSDGGGKSKAAGPRPIHGSDNVARLLVARATHAPEDLSIRYRRVNGDPSAVLFSGESPFAVLVVDLTPEGDRVSDIYNITNPDKLTTLTN